MSIEPDRPIFLVGHARGGSTALAAILNWHSHVGPIHPAQHASRSITEFLDRVYDSAQHFSYAQLLEKKELWFEYFGGNDVFTHMGKELVVEKVSWDADKVSEFKDSLLSSFNEQRFLSKAPTNSFRIKAIRQLFPSAKILAIYRNGEPVISSWGKRSYGFGSAVNWGGMHSKRLGYFRGIRTFSKKWLETIDYIESVRGECDVYTVSYEQLVANPVTTIERMFEFLELPMQDYVADIKLRDSSEMWKSSIPGFFKPWLTLMTARGNRLIQSSTKLTT